MAMTDPYQSYTGPDGFPITDCSAPALPAPDFADCPEAYVAHEGEIAKVFVTAAEWNDTTMMYEALAKPADWTMSTNYDVADIATLIGFGDKPLAEALTTPLPYNRVKTHDRRHTLNFDVTDLSLDNYVFLRAVQGTQLVFIWYATVDGYVFGGADGICARVQNAGHTHARGENALLTGQYIFEWKNLFDPPAAELDPVAPLMAGKVKQPAPLKSKPKAPAAPVEA
jgi:hypothetical protein